MFPSFLLPRTSINTLLLAITYIITLSPLSHANDAFEIGFTFVDDSKNYGRFCPANTQIKATVQGIDTNDMEVWIETLKSSDSDSLSSSGQHGPCDYDLNGDTITITQDKNSDIFKVVQTTGTIFQVNVMVKSQKASIGLQSCRDQQGTCSQWNCPTMTTSGCEPYDALYKALPDEFDDSKCPIPNNDNLPKLYSLPREFLTYNCVETDSFDPVTTADTDKFYMSDKFVGSVNQPYCGHAFMIRKTKSDEKPHRLIMAGSFYDTSNGKDDTKYSIALEEDASKEFGYYDETGEINVEWWAVSDDANNPQPLLNLP